MGYPCLLLEDAANAFGRSIPVAGWINTQELFGAELDTLFVSHLQNTAQCVLVTVSVEWLGRHDERLAHASCEQVRVDWLAQTGQNTPHRIHP